MSLFDWEPILLAILRVSRYLDEFVHGVEEPQGYVERCGGLER